MKKSITFRNMDHSDVMERYAEDQLEKIVNFLENDRGPVFIDLIFEPSKNREHHRIELRVKAAEYDLVSNYEYQGEAFYDTLDRVVDVMYHELHEKKDKRIGDRKIIGRHEEFKKQR